MGFPASFFTPNIPETQKAGLVLLKSIVVSASVPVATVDITDLTTAYDTYMVVLTGVTPVDSNIRLWLRTSTNGGATFTTSIYNRALFGSNTVSATLSDLSTNDAQIILTVGNVTGASSGVIYLNSFKTSNSLVNWTMCSRDGSNSPVNSVGSSSINGKPDAIRFMFATGSIASGEIKLYGMVKP